MPRLAPLAVAAAVAAAAVSGCSLKDDDETAGGATQRLDRGISSKDKRSVDALGFPTAGTRATTRVSGRDAAADAAGVATALFPATSATTRPAAAALVDGDQWQAGVAAGVLAGPKLEAPILLSDGGDLPPVSQEALDRLKPRGQALAKGAQVILVGESPPAPDGFKSGAIDGKDPYEIANNVDRFYTAAAGKPSRDVLIATGEDPAYAMPAAPWAARFGAPVLFAKKDSVPQPTKQAIARHPKANIYVLGPESVLSRAVEAQLKPLGARVTRIAGDARSPIESSIEFAKFQEDGFGWGAVQPGRTFTLANTDRPLDAAASAALGHNGVFAPLLVTDRADALPPPLENYFLDVQPGFAENDPVQAVVNRVWILGNREAVSTAVQARVDEFQELVPVDKPPQQ